MAVVKLGSSGKSIQFIDDEGYIYYTSVNFLVGLLNNKSKGKIILLKRQPLKAAPGRFQKSPIYDPNNILETVDEKTLDTSNDGLSNKSIEKQKKTKSFEDKKVW